MNTEPNIIGSKNIAFGNETDARWAYFFDIINWDWSYRLVQAQLKNLVPTFIVNTKTGFKNLLVEVVVGVHKLSKLTPRIKGIIKSGWDGDILVVGEEVIEDCIGMYRGKTGTPAKMKFGVITNLIMGIEMHVGDISTAWEIACDMVSTNDGTGKVTEKVGEKFLLYSLIWGTINTPYIHITMFGSDDVGERLYAYYNVAQKTYLIRESTKIKAGDGEPVFMPCGRTYICYNIRELIAKGFDIHKRIYCELEIIHPERGYSVVGGGDVLLYQTNHTTSYNTEIHRKLDRESTLAMFDKFIKMSFDVKVLTA